VGVALCGGKSSAARTGKPGGAPEVAFCNVLNGIMSKLRVGRAVHSWSQRARVKVSDDIETSEATPIV
jgi:hypothetical protein